MCIYLHLTGDWRRWKRSDLKLPLSICTFLLFKSFFFLFLLFGVDLDTFLKGFARITLIEKSYFSINVRVSLFCLFHSGPFHPSAASLNGSHAVFVFDNYPRRQSLITHSFAFVHANSLSRSLPVKRHKRSRAGWVNAAESVTADMTFDECRFSFSLKIKGIMKGMCAIGSL